MVLAVPKTFILNSLLDSKLSDSLFIINSFIINVISINVKKYQKMPKILLQSLLQRISINFFTFIEWKSGFINDSGRNHVTRHLGAQIID